jgi:hypothetical protein
VKRFDGLDESSFLCFAHLGEVMNERIRRAGLQFAIVLLGFLGAHAAFAQTVQLKELGLGNGVASGGLLLPVQSSPANYWSGFQTISVQDGASTDSFLALCVDPFQWSSGSYTSYAKSDFSTFFGSRASDIVALYNEAYSSALLGNGAAGALQLALWEVANDNKNLATGLVQTVAGTSASLATDAQGLLTNLGSFSGPSQYNFTLYTSASNQDFLVASPVPEPQTYMMLLAGLGLMGFVARRRHWGATI